MADSKDLNKKCDAALAHCEKLDELRNAAEAIDEDISNFLAGWRKAIQDQRFTDATEFKLSLANSMAAYPQASYRLQEAEKELQVLLRELSPA